MSNARPVTTIMTMIMVTMFFMNIIDPGKFSYLFIIHGKTFQEVYPWQFITYMFYLPKSIWSIFNIMIFFWFGSSLETHWGARMFMVFLFVGILGHSIASFLLGAVPVVGNWSVDLCLMVAFGFNFPREVIHLFFIIPVRVKILAIIGLVYVGIQFLFALDALIIGGQFIVDAIIPLPVSLAKVLIVLCSYLPLIIFAKYIFGSGHFRQAAKRIKNKKRIDKALAEQKKQVDNNQQYIAILHKIEKGEPLTRVEQDLLDKLDISDSGMCDKRDFHVEDEHCQKCDLLGNCVKRTYSDKEK